MACTACRLVARSAASAASLQPVDPLQQCRQGLRHVGLSPAVAGADRQQFGSLVNFSRNVGKTATARTSSGVWAAVPAGRR